METDPAIDQLTPRQRWKGTFARQPIDRLATDYWFTAEFHRKLETAVGCEGESLLRKLRIDRPRSVGPRSLGRHSRRFGANADMWGIQRTLIQYGTGAYEEATHHPLAHVTSLREVDSYPWPRADDFDYTPVREALADDDQYRLIRGAGYEPFLLYCALRGMEQAYVDLIDNPDLVDAILGRIFNFYYAHNQRIFEAAGKGRLDLFYLAEDLGGQHGPLFSLETYRRFLLPGQQKMAELARSWGMWIFYHTDGAARIFLPDLIEVVGIDILNPLQWRCRGMGLNQLVQDFSAHVVFHGGIDNQQTLPFATADAVAEEVRWCGQIMSQHQARWICAPCHNIQPVTPIENVLRLYEEAARLSPPCTIGAA
jgi:uroporphyrinogen decarboxylase